MSAVTKEQLSSALKSIISEEDADLVMNGKYKAIGSDAKNKIAAMCLEKKWGKNGSMHSSYVFIQQVLGEKPSNSKILKKDDDIEISDDSEDNEPKEQKSKEQKSKTNPKKQAAKPPKKERKPKPSNDDDSKSTLLEFGVNKYNLDFDKMQFNPDNSPEDEFPEVSANGAFNILLKLYMGDRYEDYMKNYNNFQQTLSEFESRVKNLVKEKSIFRIAKSKDGKNKKNEDDSEESDEKSKSKKSSPTEYDVSYKTTYKKNKTKTELLDPEDEMYKSLISFTEYCKNMKGDKEHKLHMTISLDESMELLKSDLIYSLEVFDYKFLAQSILGTEILLDGYAKENCHEFVKVFGESGISITNTMYNIQQYVDGLPKTDSLEYSHLISIIKEMNFKNFVSKCYNIFQGRNTICNHEALKQSMKKEMWLTALSNLLQIKNRDEWQEMWLHVLKSEYMFHVFMNCIPHAQWLSKSLECIIKNKRTIQMAMSELYPISFLFTPFMFGSDKVKISLTARFDDKSLKKATTKYLDELCSIDNFGFDDCNWIYYALPKNKVSENDTVSILYAYLQRIFEESDKPKKGKKEVKKQDVDNDDSESDEPKKTKKDSDLKSRKSIKEVKEESESELDESKKGKKPTDLKSRKSIKEIKEESDSESDEPKKGKKEVKKPTVDNDDSESDEPKKDSDLKSRKSIKKTKKPAVDNDDLEESDEPKKDKKPTDLKSRKSTKEVKEESESESDEPKKKGRKGTRKVIIDEDSSDDDSI